MKRATCKKLYGLIMGVSIAQGARIRAEDGEVYTIPYRDISCAVSDSPVEAELRDKKEILRSLLDYQAVMEKLIQGQTVVPFKFGIRLETKEDVESVLEKGYEEFTKRLSIFEGKIEADLSATWNDLQELVRDAASGDSEISRLKSETSGRPSTLSEKLRIGAIIKGILDKKRASIRDEILRTIRTAVDIRENELVEDAAVFSGAFLLERGGVEPFYAGLDALNEGFREKINFKCVAPLPPYAFTTFSIKKIGHDEISRAGERLCLGDVTTGREIKEAYFARTLVCHPDGDPDNPALEKEFREITGAYRVLTRCCNGETGALRLDRDFFCIEDVTAGALKERSRDEYA